MYWKEKGTKMWKYSIVYVQLILKNGLEIHPPLRQDQYFFKISTSEWFNMLKKANYLVGGFFGYIFWSFLIYFLFMQFFVFFPETRSK